MPVFSTGFFENTRFRIGTTKEKCPSIAVVAIASSEVGIAESGPSRRTMFPLPAAYFRQPLPVIGATVSEYYGLI